MNFDRALRHQHQFHAGRGHVHRSRSGPTSYAVKATVLGALAFALVTTTACRSTHWHSADDIAVQQAERREVVKKSVGLKQSEAQFQVAKDAWAFGDREGCLSTLDALLEREPGHVEAQLLKAEVHLAADEFIEADRSIAIALSHQPSNTTAKRLAEIAETKQLAARRPGQTRQAVEIAAAPLPGTTVDQATYIPDDPGMAMIEDDRPAPPALDPSPRDESAPPVPELVVEEFPAEDAGLATIEDLQAPSAIPPGETPANPAAPDMPIADTLLSAQAASLEAVNSDEPALPVQEVANAAAAVAESGGDLAAAGFVEITDESDSTEPLPPSASDWTEPLTAGDSAAVLTAVEERLVQAPNDPQIPISAAVSALERNQPETAASIARLGIAFHPSSAGLHRTLGAALYRSGKYASSQVALQQALSLDNSSALSYFLLGCVSEKLGDAESAEASFARATELDPAFADREP